MKQAKYTIITSHKSQKIDDTKEVFLKKIETIDKKERELLLKLYQEVLADINNENIKIKN